tara:strand:+ start:2409 stop:2528 length:120 start_codon:yes stop_codon:yes gene_type:complete
VVKLAGKLQLAVMPHGYLMEASGVFEYFDTSLKDLELDA